MSHTASKSATYADLLALPDHVVGEIVDGELHASPRPATPHAHVASTLGMDIGSSFQRGRGGPGGWWILDEPELHLGSDILVPDLAGWRRERMPTLPRAPFIQLAPDWVCEVVSPSTARLDRTGKLPIYARAEVGHAWLLAPDAHSLEMFRRDSEHWILISTHSGEQHVRAEPFAAVELELGALWL
ncbi:MAG: Uma2 family endonuclease [Pseudomonadota bacterium]